MPPTRLQVGSTNAPWYSTDNPSALAKAAVMMTRERQLPDRASNACEALRVTAASYSSRSWFLL